MRRFKGLEEVYETCDAEGMFRIREDIDKDLAESLLNSAIGGLKRSKKIENVFEKESNNYSYLFVERYDILRKLIDAFLLFDKVQISNHQCSNAYLCKKHPDLEIDFEILETLRILRNDVNYKGIIIEQIIWKVHSLRFDIYISTFSKAVQEKL